MEIQSCNIWWIRMNQNYHCLVFWKELIIEDSLPILPYTQFYLLCMKTGLWCGRWWFILLVPRYLLFYIIVREREREREVTQSCLTLCDPMDCSLPGSFVHGIFQAIVLEWIAISFSKGSSQPRDRTQVSRIVDRCFTIVQYLPFITHHNLF